jgi:predicted nucleic acid-binding protein
MSLHLDTSFLIRGLVRGSDEDSLLRTWLRARRRLAMSSIAWAEFLCGPLSDAQFALAAQIVSERLAFTENDARLASELFNRTGRRRGSLADAMIAAAAIRAGATLATANVDDFERFVPDGLVLAV